MFDSRNNIFGHYHSTKISNIIDFNPSKDNKSFVFKIVVNDPIEMLTFHPIQQQIMYFAKNGFYSCFGKKDGTGYGFSVQELMKPTSAFNDDMKKSYDGLSDTKTFAGCTEPDHFCPMSLIVMEMKNN